MKQKYPPSFIAAVLIFVTALSFSCKKEEMKPALSLTTWVISRYDDAETGLSEFPDDTLYFLDAVNYQINKTTAKEYTWRSTSERGGDYKLQLDNCLTFGSDYFAFLHAEDITDGELNHKKFYTRFGNDILVWMNRIE